MDCSKSNCREFLERLPEAVFLETLKGDIIDINREATELLGYSREELLNMEVDDLVPEDSPAFFPDEIDSATKSGEPLETANLHKDGSRIPIELRGRIVEIEGERMMLISVRDITARVRARKELEKANEQLATSKERYKDYFEKLGDAVFITKVGGEDHGKILDANKAAERQTGYSIGELIKMKIHEDLAIEPPESMDYETADKKLEKGETVTFTEKKRSKDGTQYWTEVLVTPIEYEGKKASLSINRDITERIQVNEQLKLFKMAVEGSEDLMAACDQNYRYLFANHVYRSFYGIDEDIQGRKIGELIGKEVFEQSVKPRVDGCLNGERIDYEMERTHSELGDRALRITYYPLREGQKIHGVVAVMRDITEQKATEQALNEERTKLKSLHNAVDLLQQQDSEEDLLETAVDVAEAMLNFELCAIDLLEDGYLVTKAISSGLDLSETSRYEIGEGIAGKTFQTGQTIWGGDIRNEPDAKPTSSGFRSYISIPIGEMGIFQVVSERVDNFTQRDVELSEILVGHIKEELKRVRLEKELRLQAIHDPLTKLYNRRYFNETLAKEVERCERYGHNLAFLMIDVNRFKEINDRYTHQTGDEVLREVADLLRTNVRDADTVVRYGGDEFLVMMPETNGKVEKTADRLRSNLAEWNNRTSILEFPLTLAMGVSHWNPEQDRDVEGALKEADRKMYEDKGQ